METRCLKINPADNVAVAILPLRAGETICICGKEITLRTDVPAGHKVTLKNFIKECNQIRLSHRSYHQADGTGKLDK